MTGNDVLLMKEYLITNCLQYNDTIHTKVAERRAGKKFVIEEHIAALVYAQLTNQTKWSRIVPHLDELDELFFYYNPQEIKNHSASYFADGIFALKCGNRKTKDQMDNLHKNIDTLESITNEYGSVDAFVTSAAPLRIVELLSSGKSKYKMAMMGEALAWEYMRNVGIDGCKPDTHLRRFLGNERMGCTRGIIATVDETVEQVERLSAETGLMLSVIDNIIWSYCADGFGEVCTATPHCEKCVVRASCKKSTGFSKNSNNGMLTYEALRKVCIDCGMNPTKIGQYILETLKL